MRDFNLRKWLLAALLLLLPWTVNAAGMGNVVVLSALGQPFHAEIDLVSVQKEDFASLSARLASPEAYRQANFQYNATVAGLRLSIEKRPDGQPFIKVTSAQPVNEFIVDLLVELNWASGRLLREYRALIDPPGFEPAPVVAAPRIVPAPQPLAAAPAAERRPSAPAAGSYGPIERGETLSKIARALKPEGVTVEQMLLGLFRSNPDAFIRKNMNLVRSGRILRVPEKDELSAITQQEALKEYRAQVSDWNAYRRRLADAATTMPEGRVPDGRIRGRIDDKASAEVKDVVRLSKGVAPGPGAAATGDKERIRNLEEDVIAREKALAEANERIAQLEKTIKDMQRLLEIKSPGLAAAQQQAEAKPEAAKPQTPEQPAPQAKPQPEPKPQPAKKAAPPPPPPEPSLVDMLMENLLLVAGGGAIVLGGLGLWFVRRRRAQGGDVQERAAPVVGKAVRETSEPAETTPAAIVAKPVPAMAAVPAGEVDPVAEAGIYLSHGRDAQAEAILLEALVKNPSRGDLQVKLLEVYARRKDKESFAKYAADFNKQTGGKGADWLKVAAMGFVVDPKNPLYASGMDAADTLPVSAESPEVDLDLSLDLTSSPETAPDIPLDVAAEPAAPPEPQQRDVVLESPPAEEPAPQPSAPKADSHVIDFNIELPKVDFPEEPPAPDADSKPGAEPDFKLDLSGLSLELDDKESGAQAGTKDAHWYDVQQKFDLVKVYQEMGDNEGAKKALQEVLKEGDSEQRAQAKALLAGLG